MELTEEDVDERAADGCKADYVKNNECALEAQRENQCRKCPSGTQLDGIFLLLRGVAAVARNQDECHTRHANG